MALACNILATRCKQPKLCVRMLLGGFLYSKKEIYEGVFMKSQYHITSKTYLFPHGTFTTPATYIDSCSNA